MPKIQIYRKEATITHDAYKEELKKCIKRLNFIINHEPTAITDFSHHEVEATAVVQAVNKLYESVFGEKVEGIEPKTVEVIANTAGPR